MNVFLIIFLITLGFAIAEFYNHVRREGERRAYCNGYKQAQKEENIRIESAQIAQEQKWFYRSPDYYIPTCGIVTDSKDNNEHKNGYKVDESFMENFQTNGRAITQIRKIK